MDKLVQIAPYLVAWALLTLLATFAVRALEKRAHPLAVTALAVRNLLLPLLLCVGVLRGPFHVSDKDTSMQLLLTLLGIAVIHVVLSFVKGTALTRQEGDRYQTRIPKLLVDILRLLLLLIGGAVVVSKVWGQELGGLLTAIGVSSIVLGLALQNTLDNVMAGISVLIEGPFEVGDWVRIGDVTGEVVEMNWRTVRVRTRDNDLVIVPNSVIGKETLINVSRPTRAHAERIVIGFSYDDPPNKIKRVLHSVALRTRGILTQPTPQIRVKNYADFSIEYEVRFTIDDFARLPEILDEFMTMVWYAAKRNGMTIPFPIQTSYEYHADLPPRIDPKRGVREALSRVPVFIPLDPNELESLSDEAIREEYGRGERVVNQGDKGASFFLIQEGAAIVSVKDADGQEREVARLARGEFFGEMSALTGEPRSATITAGEDLVVLVVHKGAFQRMLAARPSLAQEMAEIVEARRQELQAVRGMRADAAEQRAAIRAGASELVGRIKRFLGL
ncbi:MAG: mechanosensitive ion channel family protein [Planctomycetota bacterium]